MEEISSGDLIIFRPARHMWEYYPGLIGKVGLVLDRGLPPEPWSSRGESLRVYVNNRAKWWPINDWPMCMERIRDDG